MAVELLAGHRLESLGLEGCCAGSPGSALVKCQIVGNHMPRLKLCPRDYIMSPYWRSVHTI